MKVYVAIIILAAFINFENVECGRILAMQFFGSKSHVITYVSLLDELARRGHEITLLGPSKGLPQEKSIREIFTVDTDTFFNDTNTDVFKLKEENRIINPLTLMGEMLPKLCRTIYAMPEVKALAKEKFDLILIQPMLNDCALGLVHKLNASLVLFSPLSAPSYVVEKLGGHHPPSFTPNILLGYTDDMTFFQRFKNFGLAVMVESIWRFYYEPKMEAIYREEFGQDLPSARDILANASLILSNGHFSVSRPRPNLPDVIELGGLHSRPAKPLPKDLEDFVSKSGKDGFILFSLGSIIKGHAMPEDKRLMFVNAFSKLKQRVIWKWESESMPDLPSNVKLVKWIPQQDLLGHKNIRMFITHCGMGGTEEAIYHGVPLVGIPFFGDQDLNAVEAKNRGFLVHLDWNTMTEKDLLDAINEILNNPKYRENVKELSTIFRDQPGDTLQKAVYWMEYVLRHGGATHLKSASRKLSTLQYHSIDVMAMYLAIIFGTLYIIFSILRLVFRKLCGSTAKKSAKDVNYKKKRN